MEDSGEEETEISTVSSSPEGKVDAPLTIAGDEGDDDEEEDWANALTMTFALGERFSSFSDAAGCCCSAQW